MAQRQSKYKDKNYIMNCIMPSQLFTVKGIKHEYRALAKIWHPDVSGVKEALFIMSKINALYQEGQILIEENRFYEKERILNRSKQKETSENRGFYTESEVVVDVQAEKHSDPFKTTQEKRSKQKRTIELIASTGKCIRFKYLRRVMIELGFMYVSEAYIMLEITKLKRQIFLDSIKIIDGQPESYFKINMPNLIDTFETASHGYLVFKKERGIEPIVVLESVMGYLKPLGCRKICEGLFYDLTALKYLGLTSTGVDKELCFIDVNTGKLYNYGLFFYLHEFSSKLNRAPSEVADILNAIKPKDNESTIVDLVKKSMKHLSEQSGLIKDDFVTWLDRMGSDSLEQSLAESQVFNRSIASVTTHGFDLDAYYRNISYS